jgi:hypothetical protein
LFFFSFFYKIREKEGRTSPAQEGSAGTSGREEVMGKWVEG